MNVAAISGTPPGADSPGAFGWVGAAACAACHVKEYAAWQGSQHEQAMQVAGDKTVLGDFDEASFVYAGTRSRFFRRDGKYFVNTDGADGKLADFEILYTFGVTPLQQYLIALPGGRLQALSIAWDSRSKAEGGQRWFHLYPDMQLKAGDVLHWTGMEQNWNHQCADCHSTHLQKNFDAASNSFDTRWSELNVACEACHGPGAKHVAWAGQADANRSGADKGLLARLGSPAAGKWGRDAQGRPLPRAAAATAQVEACGRCHARRSQFAVAQAQGAALTDAYRPTTLDPGLYWPDGQMRGEVYNYGSFLQSRMYSGGVGCADCHEPHTAKLRAAGNALCLRCHAPRRYDTGRHHHHAPGSAGAACTACHMPTSVSMGIDARHDHAFGRPRPELSEDLGVPNACTSCHQGKKPRWATQSLAKWRGRRPAPEHGFARAFAAAAGNAVPPKEVVERLAAVAAAPTQAAIVRATAVARLGDYPVAAAFAPARAALADADALVREAAVNTLAHADAAERAGLAPMLADAARTVRMAALRAIAGAPERLLSAADRGAFARELEAYVKAQLFNADRPEAHTDLGALYAERGDAAAAERAYRQALQLDPGYAYASINLADLLRTQGREAEAEVALRQALERAPAAALLHHALGLALVRQRRLPEALAELQRATDLEGGNVRFAYAYALALQETGKTRAALAVLRQALDRSPGNPALVNALRAFSSGR